MIDYSELSSAIKRNAYYDERAWKYSAIISNINELINPNQVKLYYPKNLYIEGKDLELYLFVDRKIIFGKNTEKNNVVIKIYFLNDIIDFTYKCTYHGEEYFHILILKINNGDTLEFDSMNDATSYSRKYELEEIIKEIGKMIIELDDNFIDKNTD